MMGMMPHCDIYCRSSLLSHQDTIYWHLVYQSQHCGNDTRRITGLLLWLSKDLKRILESVAIFCCLVVSQSKEITGCKWRCLLQVGTTSQTVTPSLQPTPNDTTNLSNRTGRCDITLLMPTTDGNYVCTVTVSPGDTHQSSDSRQISRTWQWIVSMVVVVMA